MRFLGFGPEDEEVEEEAAALADAQEEPLRRALGAGGRASARPAAPAVAPQPAAPAPERGNVVPLGAAASRQTFKVLVVEPRSFDDVPAIADQLKNRRPVILNLEGLDKAVAQKILDFLNGAIYALGGETQKVASSIFFYAPPGVDIANVGRGLGMGGGAYDPAELAAALASAPRLTLPGDRGAQPGATPAAGQAPARSAPERERGDRSRVEWDWRR